MNPTITIRNVRLHNLKNVTLEIPKNQLVVLTGLSGSGKSSLIFDTLALAAHQPSVAGPLAAGISKRACFETACATVDTVHHA